MEDGLIDRSTDFLFLFGDDGFRFCPQAKSSSLERLEENISALQIQVDHETNAGQVDVDVKSTGLDKPLSSDSMRLLGRMNLEGEARWMEGGGRIALEWNPVDCD